MENIRKFALVAIDNFDREIERFNFDYAEAPKNLGFEMEFTTLETRLTTYFTSAKEKKTAITLNINFLPPNAYAKANSFKQFVQKYTNQRTVFEYYDTTETKNWEGKVTKFGQEELQDWGGLTCPTSFLPGTPKYVSRDNVITIQYSTTGKSYPFKYPYSYGAGLIQNNLIDNTYFDDVPLRVTVYGDMSDISVGLREVSPVQGVEHSLYSIVRFVGFSLQKGEKLVIDATQSKILCYRADGSSFSAYDYVDKSAGYDSFLYARGGCMSELVVSLNPKETGYVQASYRQYKL